MRQFDMMVPPRQRSDARLVKAGREAVYWQAQDGLQVHLARAERAAVQVPGRVAARRVDLPVDEASAPEGALAFLVQAPRVVTAPGGRDPRVGAAGLLMALWMRMFADTA